MQKTLPTTSAPDAQDRHPAWCTGDHGEHPSYHHRSRPFEIVSGYGVTTRVYLDHYDMPFPTHTTLTIEQTGICPEPHDHDANPCHEPMAIGIRLDGARQLADHLLALLEGTALTQPPA